MFNPWILIISLFLIPLYPVFPQTNRKLWGGLEVGYGLSISDKGGIYKYSYGNDTKMSISYVRGILGYYIVPQMSVGIGIGLSSYTKPAVNTVPVCLDLRYHPVVNTHNLVLNGSLGYSLLTSENELKEKILTDISVGYIILIYNSGMGEIPRL
jgi:hypothetical protein